MEGQYNVFIPSGRYALAVILNIPGGWHLYANPKQGQFGIDTEIIPKPTDGVTFGPTIYPAGEFHEDKTLNASNQIYTGKTTCYVLFELHPDNPVPVRIDLDLKGLLCSDAGVCLPWQDQASIELQSAAEGVRPVANRPDLFKGIDIQSSWPVDTIDVAGDIPADQWIQPILLALAAGLLMNLMPCVLPIIPIIVMTLIKQCAGANDPDSPVTAGRSVRVGLAFAGGIMIVFAALAVLMSIFKLLWGQQFQGIGFKLILLLIVYALSLSMFGLFEITLPSRLTNINIVRKGYLGAFAMGMLATVLATPCGAPLLTPVLTWSLGKPLPVTVAVFLTIGAGMAAPYLLLTAFPRLLNQIPKAGLWMLRLKQGIGFVMLGFVVYLILLFPSSWQGPLFYFCLLSGFSIWLGFVLVNRTSGAVRRRLSRIAAVLILAAGSFWLIHATRNTRSISANTGEHWQEQLRRYQQQNKTVIVKFTANWCKNCATLNQLIYKRQAFKDKLNAVDAELVVADWSYPDPAIKKMIYDLGGPGQALPFAAVFSADDPDHPILLRDFYSLEETLAALDQAGKR